MCSDFSSEKCTSPPPEVGIYKDACPKRGPLCPGVGLGVFITIHADDHDATVLLVNRDDVANFGLVSVRVLHNEL
jgi:hypothetical protein